MSQYGTWREQIIIDGEHFRADVAEQRYADRVGVDKIYVLDGLPSCFETNLIRASQVCDVPHTWRVQEVTSEGEVTDEILRLGKEALDYDRAELGTHILTLVAASDGTSDSFEFLGAGALRNKLNREFQDDRFPVVSRAIVVPKYRKKGLGSLLVKARMNAVLSYFSQAPNAIHFATESERIVHAAREFGKERNLKFVHIGDEILTITDGTHKVTDYLWVMPEYREKLLSACNSLALREDSLDAARELGEKLELFIDYGVEGIFATEVERVFKRVLQLLESREKSAKEQEALALIEEFFIVKQAIGAEDPKLNPQENKQ